MKATLTKREREVLEWMVRIEDHPEEEDWASMMREGSRYFIGTQDCTRCALNLIRKGLIRPMGMGSERYDYPQISEFGRMALANPEFVPPFYYVALGLDLPPEAARLLDPLGP